ncbi:MAG: type II toxin-antitoxin system PemK/MazF family toxin [Planctomycetaceae bacterium]|nr:type II toxin-antitoxin system PemK/MazF family toxin [Planctomycetaceae bacterium]
MKPTHGREQQGKRSALIVSTNGFNKSPADLVVLVPITSKDKGIPWHIAIAPPERGVKTKSFIMCETVRSVSKERLLQRWGAVSAATLDDVEDRLRILFDL